MTRPWWCGAVLLAGLAVLGHSASLADTLLRAPMPLLVTPNAGAMPPGFTPAPTPNRDINAPTQAPSSNGEPSFAPTLGTNHGVPFRSGQSYSPGSSFNDDIERRNHPTGPFGTSLAPGVNVIVPLR